MHPTKNIHVILLPCFLRSSTLARPSQQIMRHRRRQQQRHPRAAAARAMVVASPTSLGLQATNLQATKPTNRAIAMAGAPRSWDLSSSHKQFLSTYLIAKRLKHELFYFVFVCVVFCFIRQISTLKLLQVAARAIAVVTKLCLKLLSASSSGSVSWSHHQDALARTVVIKFVVTVTAVTSGPETDQACLSRGRMQRRCVCNAWCHALVSVAVGVFLLYTSRYL